MPVCVWPAVHSRLQGRNKHNNMTSLRSGRVSQALGTKVRPSTGGPCLRVLEPSAHATSRVVGQVAAKEMLLHSSGMACKQTALCA
eukprot:scaffold21034_cov18-Tisochrysis_lutea.AAC.1